MDGHKHLIWINQKKIKDAVKYPWWEFDFISNHEDIFANVFFWSDRSDTLANHPLVCVDQIHDIRKISRTKISWTEATYNRVKDLMAILDRESDVTVKILWSGGIDSTFIIASLLLFLPKQYFDRIVVSFSGASIWENPYFYHEQILPHFKIENSEFCAKTENTIYINGTLGDKLMYNEAIISWSFNQGNRTSTADNLIDFLCGKLQSIDQSQRIWEHVNHSAKLSDIEIKTVPDALWWIGFNFSWIGMKFEDWGRPNNNLELSEINSTRMYWYSSNDYQSWAMANYHQILNTPNFLLHYKQEQKRMIYSVDNNQYYLKFKHKFPSSTCLHNTGKFQDLDRWILSVDMQGNKIFTCDTKLPEDLVTHGLTPF